MGGLSLPEGLRPAALIARIGAIICVVDKPLQEQVAAVDAMFPAAGLLQLVLGEGGDFASGVGILNLFGDELCDGVRVVGWKQSSGGAGLEGVDAAVDTGGCNGESDGLGFEEYVGQSFPG